MDTTIRPGSIVRIGPKSGANSGKLAVAVRPEPIRVTEAGERVTVGTGWVVIVDDVERFYHEAELTVVAQATAPPEVVEARHNAHQFEGGHRLCGLCGSTLNAPVHSVRPTAGACTGTRYHVNPDAPEEGTDIRHVAPCPAHPDASLPVELTADELLAEHGIGAAIDRLNDEAGR